MAFNKEDPVEKVILGNAQPSAYDCLARSSRHSSKSSNSADKYGGPLRVIGCRINAKGMTGCYPKYSCLTGC